jgi:hypothetical protein
VDYRLAQGAIPDGTLDPEVLALAALSGRVLVSRDVNSMPGHFARFVEAENVSPGLILIPSNRSIGYVIDALLTVWLNWRAEEMQNQARWLP